MEVLWRCYGGVMEMLWRCYGGVMEVLGIFCFSLREGDVSWTDVETLPGSITCLVPRNNEVL